MKVEYKLVVTVEYSGEVDICQEDYDLAKSLPVENLSDWIEKRLDMNEYQGVVYNGASLTPRGGGSNETL